MTYDEAIEETVTRKEAIWEIEDHNLDPDDFLNEVGNFEMYIGKDVLDWLGY